MAVKKSSVVLIWVGVVMVALGWRAFAVPWDWGGLFIQIITSCFGIAIATSIEWPELIGSQRWILCGLLVACSLLWFAGAYFAVQAIAPLIIVCLIMIAVWGRNQKLKSKLSTTLLLALPLVGLLVYGLRYAIPVYQIRHLTTDQVQEIELIPMASSEQAGAAIRFASPTDTDQILLALRKTTPYTPNGDSLIAPWQATILLKSGERIYLQVGKGVRTNANACRIQIGASNYQNETLCRFLKTVAPQSFQ